MNTQKKRFSPQKSQLNYQDRDYFPVNSPDNPNICMPNQAARVLAKFGGIRQFRIIAKRHGFPFSYHQVYQWYKWGYILKPHKNWPMIFKIARLEGILFSSSDLDPRPYPLGQLKPAKTLIE